MVLKNAYIVFLVCGSVVAHPKPYDQLMSAVLHFEFASAIVFTAKHFQPLVASNFFLAFAELVLVEQLCVRKTFPELLSLSGRLGLHTKVILMTPDPTSPHRQLECTTFARAHTQTQPWGMEVPAQCPQCGSTKSWSEKVALTVHADSHRFAEMSNPSVTRYVYSCKYSNCGTAQRLAPHKFIIERPPGFMVNSARTTKCGWFQAPSTFYSPPSLMKGKRKSQVDASSGSAKRARQ